MKRMRYGSSKDFTKNEKRAAEMNSFCESKGKGRPFLYAEDGPWAKRKMAHPAAPMLLVQGYAGQVAEETQATSPSYTVWNVHSWTSLRPRSHFDGIEALVSGEG